jgi:hypothetical protein
MAGCRELRRARRTMWLERMVPGLACMGGLFGASIPVSVPRYDLSNVWCEFLSNPSPAPAELPTR